MDERAERVERRAPVRARIPELPRSFVLELAAPIWDSGLLEAQSGSLKMRLAALFWGWQPHFEAS